MLLLTNLTKFSQIAHKNDSHVRRHVD